VALDRERIAQGGAQIAVVLDQQHAQGHATPLALRAVPQGCAGASSWLRGSERLRSSRAALTRPPPPPAAAARP
jgi:hypothetical protein